MLQNRIRRDVKKILSYFIDSELKELIEKKTFLTGGCFKSIFYEEKVNDYDFYFIDKDSAEKFETLIKKGLEMPDKPFTKMNDLKLKTYFPLHPNRSQFA